MMVDEIELDPLNALRRLNEYGVHVSLMNSAIPGESNAWLLVAWPKNRPMKSFTGFLEDVIVKALKYQEGEEDK